MAPEDSTPSSGAFDAAEEAKIWDPALRLFHWLLALAFATSYLLGQFGPNIMTWHFWSGYVICGLLVFRLLWGLIGTRPARFASFLAGPRAVLSYARSLPARRPSHWPGHNPLGGWSVVAMLALLLAQVLSGLVADPEDYINTGPLASYFPAWVNRAGSELHANVSSLMLYLVLIHIGVILFYRYWKREDLIGPMIHGRKLVRRSDPKDR